jgi:DNA modification methylase
MTYPQDFLNKIIQGDCLEVLKTLPDESVDCCITSPPYFGLRDYGVEGQIGLEGNPESFVLKIVEVFREVRRVLKSDGTLWLNLGDTYSADRWSETPSTMNKNRDGHRSIAPKKNSGLPPKNLIGIPWRVAFALQADGWVLRQDIIWAKPNPMPESVTDRCTKAHEYIFLLSKSSVYHYDSDSIREPLAPSSIARLAQDIENQKGSVRVPGKTNGPMKAVVKKSLPEGQANLGKFRDRERKSWHDHKNDLQVGNRINKWVSYPEGRNKRSVWNIPTAPFAEAHFATFPENLIVPMVKAGCPLGGVVLDPFMGAGTAALVAQKLARHYVGIELNPEYIKIAQKRLSQPVLI